MHTFQVSNVPVARDPMPALAREQSIRTLLHRRVEQIWVSNRRLVSCTDANALAQAAHDAFYLHYPLVLTPDAVWFCLAQGFAHHIAQQAEELRHHFVRHEGKLTLVVERTDFLLGQDNPWPEAFAAFSDQIAAHVGKRRDLVVADFSTTGPIERAASEVVLMDAFSPYFKYEMLAGCGIPSITLLGTPDDWRSIRLRAAMFSEFGLEDWVRALSPVLDEIVSTAQGKTDLGFWRSFFRYESSSGGAELTGWIHVLFPYLKTRNRDGTEMIAANPYLSQWEQAFQRAEERAARKLWLSFRNVAGPDLGALPSSVASAPVRLVDLRTDTKHDVRFVAGLFGAAQDEATLALQPEFGWGVVYDD